METPAARDTPIDISRIKAAVVRGNTLFRRSARTRHTERAERDETPMGRESLCERKSVEVEGRTN